MSTESGAPAANNAAPANAPPLVETGGDPQAAEEEQRETPKTRETVRFELELDAETAGPSASLKAAQPGGQRRR